MSHISWDSIYSYFVAKDTTTLVDCSRKFGVHIDYVRQKAAAEKWTAKKLQIRQNALALMEQQAANEIVKRNQEHIKQARLLQGTALEAIAEKGLRPETFDVARKALEVGQKLERVALNMDARNTPSVEISNHKGQVMRVTWGDGQPLGDFKQADGHWETIKTYDSY